MNSEPEKKEKEYLADATKKAFEGEPMSDESVENAFNLYREKKANTGEGVPENKQAVLALSKSVMRENAFRKRRKRRIMRFSLSSSCVVLAMFVFACVLYFNTSPVIINDSAWKSMLTITKIDYTSLEQQEGSSIHQLNKDKYAEFYWLENLEKTSTSFYYSDDKMVLIKETYLYHDIPCTLYVMNKDTEIMGLGLIYNYSSSFNYKDLAFQFEMNENDSQFKFVYQYNYYLKIESSNAIVIEHILSNLTKGHL